MNSSYTISRSYENYRERIEDPLPLKSFMLLMEVFKRISRSIIVDKIRYKIPLRLGYVRVVCDSDPKNKVNESLSVAKRKLLSYTNFHTGGKMFRFKWIKRDPYCSFTNRNLYSFTPVPDKIHRYIGRRGLAQHIFECSRNPNIPDYMTIEK